MVAGGELGGGDADTTTDVGFLQDLLGQRGEAVHLSLSRQHRLQAALFRRGAKNNLWLASFQLNPVGRTTVNHALCEVSSQEKEEEKKK